MTTLDFTIIGRDQVGAALASVVARLDALTVKLEEVNKKAVNILVKVDDGAAAAKLAATQAAIDKANAKAEEASKKGFASLKTALAGIVLGSVAVVGATVDVAAKYETLTTRLTTSAGEQASAIGRVSAGMLTMAGQVGIGANDLAKGMYIVESAGFHMAASGSKAADALTILRAAAQGAKDEGADLSVVANGVTTELNDYHLGADKAATVTSQLVVAVSLGKTNMQDFSGALHSITPLASSMGISLADVAGSLAMITSHGEDAAQGAQNLAETLRTLQKPSSQATAALAQIGMTVSGLQDSLSQNGLQGTLQNISEAIMKKMGPSGKIMLDAFNSSKQAAANLSEALKSAPPDLKKLANEFVNGTITGSAYHKAINALPADQKTLGNSFAGMVQQASGFTNTLKTGGPQVLTYNQMLQAVTGNATTMNMALMLTKENSLGAATNIKQIAAATADANGNVMGFAEVQKTLNQQLSEAKASLESVAIRIGQLFIPFVLGALHALMDFGSWVNQNRVWLAALAGGVAAFVVPLLAIVVATKAWTSATALWTIVTKTSTIATADMTKAQAALNLVMDTNPIILIILAVLALIAAFVILWNKSAAFRSFWENLWKNIVKIAKDVAGWIVDAFHKMISFFSKIVDAIAAPFIAAFNWIKKTISAIFTPWWKSHGEEIKAIWNAVWTVIRVIFTTIWNYIVAAAKIYWDIFSTIFKVGLAVLTIIFRGAWAIISGIVRIAWDVIVGVAKVVWDIFSGIFQIGLAYLKFVFKVTWDAIVAVFKIIWDVLVGILNVFLDLVTGHWGKAWADFKAIFVQVWNAITGFFKGALDAVFGMFDSWGRAIGSTAENVWHAVVGTFNNLKNDLVSVFKSIVNDGFIIPINFVVDHVMNGGIIAAINTITGLVGIPKIPPIPDIPKFARGGVLPGHDTGVDSQLVWMRPGEGVLIPEVVKALGGAAGIDALNAMAIGGQAGGHAASGHFDLGGVFTWVGNVVSGIGSGIKNAANWAAGLARGALADGFQGLWDATIKPLLGAIPGQNTFIVKDLESMANHWETQVHDWLKGKDKPAPVAPPPGSGGGGGSGVAQWNPLILQALAALGQPASWLPIVDARMNQESGGNPRAINLTDSNAQRGDPSRGLMQTIMSTFNAYKPPGATDIYDPYSNIYAGLNYAIHRYGSLIALTRPGGYADGGIVSRPTLAMLGESGTEVVLPLTKPRRVAQLLAQAGLSGSPGQTTTVTRNYTLVINAQSVSPDDLRAAFQRLESLGGL